MSRRKHISDRKRAAIFALALGDVPYADAKQMTEDQILSLYHLDHNMLHSSRVQGTEHFSNYTPMLIKAHREKTKHDAAIIAKSRRIRRKFPPLAQLKTEGEPYDPWAPLGAGNQAMIAMADAASKGLRDGVREAYERISRQPDRYSEGWNRIFKKHKRKIQSRGFDKTKRRKMDGTVVKR